MTFADSCSSVRCGLALLIVVAAAGARAAENDLELWRLGHPDCLGCDAAGKGGEAGDPNAQVRFHKLASTLGLAFAPPFQETAGTLGQAGFEVGVSTSEAFLRIHSDAWPTSASSPPKVLTLPAVTLRKGLGGSFELGAAVSWLANSQMMALSAELRWAILDGVAYAPDLAVRAWATRVLGTQDLDLALGGADAQLSKSFGVAGMVKLQPYFQGGIAMVNAQSAVVNFKPSVDNPTNPIAQDGLFHSISFQDNRFFRAALGFRMLAGVVVLGLEGGLAWGQNAIQSDPLARGEATPATDKNSVRLWSSSARLGFAF
jgi:hypothetical protein